MDNSSRSPSPFPLFFFFNVSLQGFPVPTRNIQTKTPQLGSFFCGGQTAGQTSEHIVSWPPTSSSSPAGRMCPGDSCPSRASPPGPPSPLFDRLCESVDCSTLRRWPVWSNQNYSPFFLRIFFFPLKGYLSLLLKDQILEEVCGMKGSGDRFAAQSLWPVSLLLLSASLREGRVTLVWFVGGSSSEAVAARGWEGAGQGGRVGWGRGFVLRASDDVLIFISCYWNLNLSELSLFLMMSVLQNDRFIK